MDLWHSRLGHVGEKRIKELTKKGVIKLDADGRLKKSEPCILAKAQKLPYAAGVHNSKAPLEYVHSDLWGPSQTESMGGGKYFISIIEGCCSEMLKN